MGISMGVGTIYLLSISNVLVIKNGNICFCIYSFYLNLFFCMTETVKTCQLSCLNCVKTTSPVAFLFVVSFEYRGVHT